MVALDSHELLQTLELVRVVRKRMERVGHADVVVCPIRAFGDHDVRGHARQVRLVGKGDEVEHDLDLLVERIELADRRFGQLDTRQIALLRFLDAPFDLDGQEVRVAATGASQNGVMRVGAIEAALKANWSAGAIDGVKISADGLLSDIHGSSDYRANLIKVMAQRAVQAAG